MSAPATPGQGGLFDPDLGSLFCDVELLPLTPRDEIRFAGSPAEVVQPTLAGEAPDARGGGVRIPADVHPLSDCPCRPCADYWGELVEPEYVAAAGRRRALIDAARAVEVGEAPDVRRPSAAEVATPAERLEMFDRFGWTS